MDARSKRYLHIAIAIAAIFSSVASVQELFIVGATRWTTAFNVLSLVLVLLAVKTWPTRQP